MVVSLDCSRKSSSPDCVWVVDGLTMWLNGYSGNKITDMELKKLIAVHGGTIR